MRIHKSSSSVGLVVIALLLLNHPQVADSALDFIGCYMMEDAYSRSPEMNITVGNFNQDYLTPKQCARLCQPKHMYAGLRKGRLCSCGNAYGQYSSNEVKQCTLPCSGDATKLCGSDTHNSIYAVPPVTIASLDFVDMDSYTAMSPMTVLAFNETFFSIVINGSAWASLDVDFGDGNIEPLTDVSFSHHYLSSGPFHVRTTAMDAVDTVFSDITYLQVHIPISGIKRLCPFVVLRGQEFDCEFSFCGTGMTVLIVIEDIGSLSISLADAVVAVVGPNPDKGALRLEKLDSSGRSLKVSNPIEEDADLVGWEVVVKKPGQVDLMIYRPVEISGKQYCQRSRKYIDLLEDCDSQPTPAGHRCSTDQTFSLIKRSCVDSQTGAIVHPTPPRTAVTYTKVSDYSFAVDVAGKQFVPLPAGASFELKAGDLMGYQSQGGGVILRVVSAARNADMLIDDSVTVSISSSPDLTSAKFLYGAVTVRCASLLVKRLYPWTSLLGPRDLDVSVVNAVSSQSLSSYIHVEDVIGNVTLVVSEAAVTFETVTVLVEYDGRALAMDWHMGDGTTFNTTANPRSYSWAAPGIYNITVNVSNHYNWEVDAKLIVIQDVVLGLNWTSALTSYIESKTEATFAWSATNGTDVQYLIELDWNLGQPLTNVTDDMLDESGITVTTLDWSLEEFSVVLSNNDLTGLASFKPQGHGNLSVSILVFNLVSSMRIRTDVLVQIAIEGLSVWPTPARRFGDDIAVSYDFSKGSEIKMHLDVDGRLVAGTCATTGLEGDCMLRVDQEYFEFGDYDVTLTAYNDVSGPTTVNTQLVIQIGFTGDDLIVTYSPGQAIPTYDLLNITLVVTQGSGVNRLVDFGDGSPAMTGLSECLFRVRGDKFVVSHNYTAPGVYSTKVLIWNLFSSANHSSEIRVQNPVTTLSLDEPVLGTAIGVYEGDAYDVTIVFSHVGGPAEWPTDAAISFSIPSSLTELPVLNISSTYANPLIQVLTVPGPGRYLGIMRAFNLISEREFDFHVEMDEILENLAIFSATGHYLAADVAMTFILNVTWGSRITFEVDFGDGKSASHFSENREVELPNIYTTVGYKLVQVNASNPFGLLAASLPVTVLYKVQGFSLMVPIINILPLGEPVDIVVHLYIDKGVDVANNATVSITFDDDDPFIYGLTAENTSTPALNTPTKTHLRSFQMTYNTTGQFLVSALIWNPSSSQEMFHEFWIYQIIAGLQSAVNYNEISGEANDTTGDPALDQPAIVQDDGLYGPIDHAVVMTATYIAGNRLTFTWGFGETQGVYSVTQEPRAIFRYQFPGTYTITLNVSNLVSYMTASLTITIQVPIYNVTLRLLDIGDKSSNVTMFFEMHARSVGSSACYRLDFQDSKLAAIVYFGSREVCIATFATEIQNIDFPFVFKEIDFEGVWRQNRGGPWAMTATNVYDNHGLYDISVTAKNKVSNMTFVLTQIVLKPECFPPTLSVRDVNRCGDGYPCALKKKKYRAFLASVQVKVELQVSFSCKSSKRAWYDWTVSFLGKSLQNDMVDYDLPADVATSGLSLGGLSIKATTFQYGWYHFRLNVSMYQEYPPMYAVDSTYIRIDPTPLEVHIFGGDEVRVTFNYTTTVDAEQLTYDPDVPRTQNAFKDLTFVWLCRRKSYLSTKTGNTTYDIEPFEIWDKYYKQRQTTGFPNKNKEIDASDNLVGITDQGGCFGLSQDEEVPAPTPGGKLPFNTGKITFHTGTMYYNMMYELQVAVIKGNRVSIATQTLDVQEGMAPILIIFCKVNCKNKLNPSNRYSLESSEAFGAVNFFGLYYWWVIYEERVSPATGWVPVERWLKYASTPRDRANLVIEPGFFLESRTYKLTLWGSRNADLSNAGRVSLIVNVNDRPRGGKCSISPPEGKALQTSFSISCNEWTDSLADLPLSYTFRIEKTNDSSSRIIHASPHSTLLHPTKFNQGLPANDYKVRIFIDVTDNKGCFKTTNITVKVLPLDKEAASVEVKLIQSNMEGLFATGNKEAGANLALAMADYMNTEVANNETEDPSAPTQRAKVRDDMATMLSEATVDNLQGIQQLSSAMAAVTKVPKEVSLQSRTLLLSSMEDYSKVMQDEASASNPISVEQLEETTAVCMEVVENLVQAAHTSEEDVGKEDADTGVSNMQKSEEVIDRLALAIADKIVMGQNDIVVSSAKSALILAKSPVLWLSGKNFSSGDGNSLQLPEYEELFQDVDNFTAVTQKFIMRDRNTKLFAAGSDKVKSMVVTLTLINETSQMPLVVSNATSPIEINIARKKEHYFVNGTGKEVHVNQTATVGGKMTIHRIDIPQYNAFSMDVRSLGIDNMKIGQSYEVMVYVFFRTRGYPSFRLHDLNCTLSQMLTVVEDITESSELVDLDFSVVLSNGSETRCFFTAEELDSLRNGSALSLSFGVNHEVILPTSDDDDTVATKTGSAAPDDDNRFHPMLYALTTSLYSCLAIGDDMDKWSTDGCVVGENSTDSLTQCFCNHLTTFGGGFQIPVNHIDLSDSAFLHLDENPVAFAFMVSCLCVYFLVLIWAFKADKRDIVKAGITPLPDNDPRDQYLYEITVFTGLKGNAGTTANVTILISGELGDSTPRLLCDPKRKVLQQGGIDSFLLANPVSLGNMAHVRVWHDNQGRRPSWFLTRIMIKDLRQDRTFYFMADRWLALEEDDGMIERVIPVAGRSELTQFGHLFYAKTRRNLSDSHIWFSVFARPAKSRFTRMQRASCCLSLLFCTMTANILFYGIDFQAVDGNQTAYTIGPLSFTFSQVITGIISSLIVLPVNLVVVQLFRVSQPLPPCTCCQKQKRGSGDKFYRLSNSEVEEKESTSDLEKELARMEEASEADSSVPSISQKLGSQASLQSSSTRVDVESPPPDPAQGDARPAQGGADPSQGDTHPAQGDVRPAQGDARPAQGDTHPPQGDTRPPQGDARPAHQENTLKPVGIKKTRRVKKGLELPWGFCVLAWVLVVASVLVTFWLTIEIAGQFGKIKALEWLTTMGFSLIQDIFLTQPIKVLLLAFLVSLIFRSPVNEEEADELVPHLQEDEEWLHSRTTAADLQDPSKMAAMQRQKNQGAAKSLAPLHPDELDEARNIRFKEIKMHKIIREIVFYLTFLQITMMVCMGDRDASVYYVNKSMTDMFVKASYNGLMPFTKIRERDHFWNYTENVFLPSLYSYTWYNGEPDEIGTEENILADGIMHLVGRVRFRQLRIQKDACIKPHEMVNRTHDCRATYSITDEEDDSYDVGWQFLNDTDKLPDLPSSHLADYAHRYRKAWEHQHWFGLDSFPYFGRHALYNGGGYLAEFGDTLQENLDLARELRQSLWVDQYTRAVFLEFVVYNANIQMYSTSFLLVEFLPQGGALTFPNFWTMRLDRYNGTFAYFVLACQAIYALFILYFLVREIRAILREKAAYFTSIWNLCEVAIVGLALTSMAIFLYRLFVGKGLMEQWREEPHMFLNFSFVAYWDQVYGYITGLVLFLVTIKFLRLLRFNRRLLLFSITLCRCSKELVHYSILFGMVFVAYALFAYALFHVNLSDFSTFITTLETLFSTILGKFNFQALIEDHDILGPVFFFSYVTIIVFVMLNMFLSIIIDAFGKVRHDSELIENELEIVDFMMQRFKAWSGISERRLKKPVKTPKYIEDVDPTDVECELLGEKLRTMVAKLNGFIRTETGLKKSEGRQIFISN